MMGIYGGNPHIPAENVLCLLWMWVKGTMNLLPEWGRGAVGAGWEVTRGLERNHPATASDNRPPAKYLRVLASLDSLLRHRTVTG